MEISLHLGAHRSGSTTLQSVLWGHRVRLAQAGVTVWTPRRTRDGLMRGLMRHPALVTRQDDENAMRSLGRIRIEIARLEWADQQSLLISEENILGTMLNNALDTRLYPLLQDRLLRLRPAFDGHPLRIGLCIRSYEDYWASCLAYLVRRGHAVPGPNFLDCLTTQPRRWRTLIRDIAAVFPQAEIVVWTYERMAGQPHQTMSHLTDRALPALGGQDVWRNRGADLVEMNKVMALRGERPLGDALAPLGTRWMPFDEDQRSVLRAEYSRDIAWLKAGAQGLATYVDGRPTPATSPDRAKDIPATVPDAAIIGGQYDGIKEGLGRTGAS